MRHSESRTADACGSRSAFQVRVVEPLDIRKIETLLAGERAASVERAARGWNFRLFEAEDVEVPLGLQEQLTTTLLDDLCLDRGDVRARVRRNVDPRVKLIDESHRARGIIRIGG